MKLEAVTSGSSEAHRTCQTEDTIILTDIFNVLCFVGTMLQPVFATDTDSRINITFRNMDMTTSTHIMELQHVQ